jgi:EAL domain-containing protein (putative c-di-GMP-specific phosphodiesterase class I)
VAIVQAVTGLASSLGIATTAEGVETLQQCEQVRQLGCTDLQGFFFSPPRPLSDIQRLLTPRLRGPRITWTT